MSVFFKIFQKSRRFGQVRSPHQKKIDNNIEFSEKCLPLPKPKIMSIMKKALMITLMAVIMCLSSAATDFKTYENEIFSIGYPSDWEVTYEGDDCMNVATEDGEICFDVTYNERGPMKNQLQEAADNWEYMKKGSGHVVDQKLVKDDYALVRSIETDEDDGTQTVVVWFLMITQEPQCFSGSIQSPMSRANEAIDILVEMLATLTQK